MISPRAVKKLRALYIDEQVIIYLAGMNVVAVDENQQELKISAMVEGYVIDLDTDYFYLGLPDGTITRTVSHDLAKMVEIQIPSDPFMALDVPMDEDVH